MQWHKVEISGLGPRDFQTRCEELIDAFHERFLHAAIAGGVDIYRQDLSARKCVFYFPPSASSFLLAKPALKKVLPCEEPLDLSTFRKINFR